jgi:hypothetical protein
MAGKQITAWPARSLQTPSRDRRGRCDRRPRGVAAIAAVAAVTRRNRWEPAEAIVSLRTLVSGPRALESTSERGVRPPTGVKCSWLVRAAASALPPVTAGCASLGHARPAREAEESPDSGRRHSMRNRTGADGSAGVGKIPN